MNLYDTLKGIFTTSATQYSDAAIALSCLDALSKPGAVPENPPDDYRIAVTSLVLIIMTRFEAVLKCASTAPTGADLDVLSACVATPLRADGARAEILFRLLIEEAAKERDKKPSTV